MNSIKIAWPQSLLEGSHLECVNLIQRHVNLRLEFSSEIPWTDNNNLLAFLRSVADACNDHPVLAECLNQVIYQCTLKSDFGGYELSEDSAINSQQQSDVVFLCAAYLEAWKSMERAQNKPKPLHQRPDGRRGMTMAEKIFAMHDVSRRGYVAPGDIIQVDVDWILASELSWAGMERVYTSLGSPGIFRNDRFWLAGDHRVEPPLYDRPAVKALMKTSAKAQRDFKMTDFQGFNYTIMHTEFARERAQPGMLCIGADSHSCSAGSVSCLSIGMGATDVVIPLITGQTWFTVPETVHIKLVGAPPRGVSGKDIILHILGHFKRNTVAADRVVEFGGVGLQHLSCDARFAIANMCTEFGAVTGIFESDKRTQEFINRRHLRKHKQDAIYFKSDEDAVYVETFEVDLSEVESSVALFPSPDNVVPVSEAAGTKLDGTFIGACTTAEEDLIIAAHILRAGLNRGWRPVNKGRRRVVPGSRPILHKLEKLGLSDVFREAGFTVGIPGCSMCVGQGTDQAAPGEVWLSSQNRNFKHRMGPDSIANLASAATVAASSFDMVITDPRSLLDDIDMDVLRKHLGYSPSEDGSAQGVSDIVYHEPYGLDVSKPSHEDTTISPGSAAAAAAAAATETAANPTHATKTISGKSLVLGDFIDTDAIIPSKFLHTCKTDSGFGSHCMEFFMPDFRATVQQGHNIIVAGHGFGVGSSRDVAVNSLKGAGVQCVIAKSFAFIYARNQPNLGLLGIVVKDERFHELARDGEVIEVDVDKREVRCCGEVFGFGLSEMERQLIAAGGMTGAFRTFGKKLFNVMCSGKSQVGLSSSSSVDAGGPVADMENIGRRTVDETTLRY